MVVVRLAPKKYGKHWPKRQSPGSALANPRRVDQVVARNSGAGGSKILSGWTTCTLAFDPAQLEDLVRHENEGVIPHQAGGPQFAVRLSGDSESDIVRFGVYLRHWTPMIGAQSIR
jgi:hypothetical protein